MDSELHRALDGQRASTFLRRSTSSGERSTCNLWEHDGESALRGERVRREDFGLTDIRLATGDPVAGDAGAANFIAQPMSGESSGGEGPMGGATTERAGVDILRPVEQEGRRREALELEL